ncbi:MAG: SusC/RagA family TonB-linked outer membrane protein [Prevotella sp.]
MRRIYYLGAAFAALSGTFAPHQAQAAAAQSPRTTNAVQQQTSLSGIVTDANGEPVTGASVAIEGKGVGAVTDINGRFTIDARPGDKLTITYVGYNPMQVTARADMRITLTENASQLGEVVVVGYGTQKKVNLTGAVANVNVKDAIASRPITDVAKALQGITPGLTITNRIGGVGTQSAIKLRGSVGSLSAEGGTSPLILVDNVEVPNLNLVNPDDIETISVLKDAASASIYGTRAAWGVILITTKQGAFNDKVNVTYSNNFAWSTPTKMPEQMKASDNARFIFEIMKSKGKTRETSIGYTIDEGLIKKLEDWENKYGGMSQDELGEMQEGRDFEIIGSNTYFYRSFDPIKEFTRKWTPQQNHNLSVTGGSKKTTYNISLSYLNQTGVMKYNSDQYDRYTLHSSITSSIRDWWKVRANVLFTRTKNDEPYRFTSGQFDAWFYLLRWPRWYPYATYKGRPFRSAVTDIKHGNRENTTTTYVRTNLGTEITPLKNLSINFDYTFSFTNDARKLNGGTVYAYDMFASAPFSSYTNLYGLGHNMVEQSSQYTLQNIFKGYATYMFNLDEQHNFKLMAGFDAETREAFSHYSERQKLYNEKYPEIALAYGNQFSYNSNYSYHNDFAAAGVFGRLNYDYMQRYLLEFNLRYDGSSRFPVGKKWAFFPSLSAGWRASEEKFMDWAKPALSNFKLRGSWGTIGNQDVAAYAYLPTMAPQNSGWVIDGKNVATLNTPSVSSDALTWERVSTLDLGFDASFFNNDLNVTFDWYRRVTSGMHTAGEQLPATFGATVPKKNFGEITGTGLEIGVNYQHQFSNGLGISASASFSHVKEVITKFNSQTRNINGNYQGKRLGEIWGYETDRLFQADDFDNTGKLKAGIPSQSKFENDDFKFGPGDVKYKDLDGDKAITYGDNTVENPGDQRVIGNFLPNYEYSFSLGASYKGFDFNMFFQGVGKRDFWVGGAIGIPAGGSGYKEAAYKHQLDYWTPSNTGAFYPRPTDMSWNQNGQNYLKQTRFLANMAYLRCKNITLGYTLPQNIVNKALLQSVRVYVSAENLFEFENLRLPIDPETTEYKRDAKDPAWSFGRSYPYTRTISFGLQAAF